MDSPSTQDRRGTLPLWMIVAGLFAIWAGASDILARWHFLASGARICDVLIVCAGALLLSAGVWHLLGKRNQRLAAAAGAFAAGIFTVTLFIGVGSGAIPCSGPS